MLVVAENWGIGFCEKNLMTMGSCGDWDLKGFYVLFDICVDFSETVFFFGDTKVISFCSYFWFR